MPFPAVWWVASGFYCNGGSFSAKAELDRSSPDYSRHGVKEVVSVD